jgi:hypothetical protein
MFRNLHIEVEKQYKYTFQNKIKNIVILKTWFKPT